MKATDLLKRQHREAKGLLKDAEECEEHDEREELVMDIVSALKLHTAIEEQLFYPAVQEATKESDAVLKAMEEHDLVKVLLQQLQTMSPEEDRFDAKVAVLMQNVREHVEEEEGEIFPKLREALKRAQLEELGTRLEEGKKAIQSPKDYLKLK